ncbi:sigma-70 family RNA polymerase sigma factor [Aeromicrobium camelliae]|uniref:Sigma-70 family RNA polymerase sigma factor n=1 Tax=Aeromicrobium camelliae TaxID=1538144 RepID=A0A3N6WAN2_9ACTN|nr:sigma-70 family RNA polymerase sigma factor [Aeromicrobium camelliae]RQN02112.1 sigma-70 family RNA polymerase sigma factor [Aeromicrobium camelliae]
MTVAHSGGFAVSTAAPFDVRAVWIALSEIGAPSGESRRAAAPPDPEESERVHALVELARTGDAEAFGQLYDIYVSSVYRFIYYRVGSRPLAEDLTSDTFMRALGAVGRFTWQGKDFGAWLTTIARNLVTDHHKSARSRLEVTSDTVPDRGLTTASSETEALSGLDDRVLYEAIQALAPEQRDCVVMRFMSGMSIAQTAAALSRSEGAVKQLQLRALRNLAAHLPEELRPGP